MALHFLDQPSQATKTIEALGTGLASGLENLAQGKLQQLYARNQQAQTATGLQALSKDITPEQAQQLAMLPPQTLDLAVKNLLNQPGEQAYAQAINQLLGGEQATLPEGARLNAKQATDLANLQFKKEEAIQKHMEKKQAAIDATNAPFNKEWHNTVTRAKEIKRLQQSRLEDIRTGKVQSRDWGIWPHAWQTKETQQYIDKGDELAPIIAANKGVATNFKIKLAKQSKGDINDDTETQIAIGEENIAAADEVLEKEAIRNQLIEENDGEQPKNLNALMEKRYQQLQKDKANGESESLEEIKKQLLQQNAPVGTMIVNDEGETLYWDGANLVEKP